jgi:hypothetical protein
MQVEYEEASVSQPYVQPPPLQQAEEGDVGGATSDVILGEEEEEDEDEEVEDVEAEDGPGGELLRIGFRAAASPRLTRCTPTT